MPPPPPAPPDARRNAPATGRNRDAILDVLRTALPASGPRRLVLEIASGTGQHAAFLAAALPHLDWQPSEPDPALRASIAAWARETAPPNGPANLRAPLDIDVGRPGWDISGAEGLCAILNVNMIHISPWRVAEGLFDGAGRLLATGGLLYLYGPFRRDGRHTAPSNEAFDRGLRHQNPDWGVRDLDHVAALAARHGLRLDRCVDMPANNFSVLFVRN